MFIQSLFFAFSLTLSLLFFLYGFNHYYLLNAARSYRTPVLPEPSGDRPAVSVQLPIYNEKYVVRRLVSACACMAEAYGIDRVKILVLDDSDDDSVEEVDQVVREYRDKGFRVEVLRRACRDGYKAGALQAALERTGEEFIAIFDADFLPSPDFLLRTVPYFDRDECLGIVQSRWTYLNKDFSLLTQAISHAIDVHFLIEQPGRFVSGIYQNFNGSGGVIRKKAILAAGGWRADTLAEDLDLSYRMQMLGYRMLYLKDLLCPGEIPPTVPSFKLQQGRWACGSMKTALKILPGLLRDRTIGFKQRLQAVIHLTGYMIQPLMVFSFVLSCLATFLGVNTYQSLQGNPLLPASASLAFFVQNTIWVVLTPFIALCTLAPWVSLVSTIRIQKLSIVRNLASLLVLVLLCFGISLSTLRGVGKALFSNRTWEWVRTPKYADLQDKKNWRQSRYQMPFDPLWIWELIFVLAGLGAIGTAIQHSYLSGLFILVPFTVSYGFVLLSSILQSPKAKG